MKNCRFKHICNDDVGIFFFGGGGGPPEFLDLDYKIQTVSDHDFFSKFYGDRPRDLDQRVAK